MAVKFKAPQAKARALIDAGTWGKNTKEHANLALSASQALAQNEKAALALIPAYTRLDDFRWVTGALGATTGIEFGYETVDGVTAVTDYFGAEADTSTAQNGRTAALPIVFEKDTYLTATQTGGGTANANDIDIVFDYEFLGGD